MIQRPIMQRGFTLVELLIALAISLFLLAALVQIMASSTQTYRAHEGVSRIQEGGRFAMEIIGRQIRSAGYHSNSVSQNLGADLTTWPLNQAANYAIDGSNNNGANNTDILNIRYYIPDDCAAADCLTVPVPMTGVIPSGDWIRVTFQTDVDRVLRCQIFDSAGNDRSSGDQPLLEGVADMQIIYGINLGGNMRYESANTIDASEWPNVVSVRLNLTLDSINVVNPNSPALTASGGRLERPYTSTFTIRNRIPGA